MQNEGHISPAEHALDPAPGVCFDGENVRLEGSYNDEISAYRARKVWSDVLATHFLLEREQDIDFKIEPRLSGTDSWRFILQCNFLTACARYAFWRLTNGQTPEAQYVIETAHIPDSPSRRYDFMTASDLRPLGDHAPAVLGSGPPALSLDLKLIRLARRLIRQMSRHFT